MLLALGCSQEEKVIPLKGGSIVGFVKLYEENGSERDDNSNVKVTLDSEHFTMTNEIGRFEFNDISPGTFRVIFEKEGYSYVEEFNFSFTAGNEPAVISGVSLIKLPEITMQNPQFTITASGVTVSATISPTDSYYFIYYFGDSPEVSNEDFVTTYGYSFCCGEITEILHGIPLPNIEGDIYMACYGVSTGNTQGAFNYYDFEKGLWINTAVKKQFNTIKVK